MVRKFKDFIDFIGKSQGIDLSVYEDSFVEKSIENRRSIHGNSSLTAYYNFLIEDEQEARLFIESLQVAYSEFFRNPITFAYLEQFVLPMLWAKKNKRNETELRIWSAACASGQESYSLAIILDEMKAHLSQEMHIRIFATDNNQEELGKARDGIFTLNSLHKVSLKRIQSYFSQREDVYTITSSLKKYVDFSYFDLLSDERSCPTPSIYGNFDLVFCSNLLFYYKPAFRIRILEKIANTLAPEAYLVTGETEREILLRNGYQEVFENSAIFMKKG